jgi:predicted transcriptional regulator
MGKRNKLEIMRDILQIIQDHKQIRPTPLLRQSNISSSRFKNYFSEMIDKKFVKKTRGNKNEKLIVLTNKGNKFLEKYQAIVYFIEEFEL